MKDSNWIEIERMEEKDGRRWLFSYTIPCMNNPDMMDTLHKLEKHGNFLRVEAHEIRYGFHSWITKYGKQL